MKWKKISKTFWLSTFKLYYRFFLCHNGFRYIQSMNKFFFCGIGGIGMSALARFLHDEGHDVFGSDSTDSPLLAELQKEGIQIFSSQSADNLPEGVEELIFSEAVPATNPERAEAKRRGIPQMSYFGKLGGISQEYFTICVAGTHGKSTTTVMSGLALEKADFRPNVLVGTKVFEWGNRNMKRGKSNILLVEACEYRESFLYLRPDIIVLTAIEPDHLDYYGTKEKYFLGFKKFIEKLTREGVLIGDIHDPAVRDLSRFSKGKMIDSSPFLGEVPPLLLKGEHYRENASKVLALFESLDLDLSVAKKALMEYRGAWRRFELKGTFDGIPVIDDYGHHPTEIRATLKAFKETYPARRKWVVSQPHQYSRTADFLHEFGDSFQDADEVLIPNIYKVRDSDEDLKRVSPEILVETVTASKTPPGRVRYTEDFKNTVRILREETRSGDVILTIGAGPVHEVGEMFLSRE